MQRLKNTTILFLVLFSSTLIEAKAGAEEKSNLKVLDVKFEPIHQGKNTLRVKVKNTSDHEQVFGIHIQTKSPKYRGRFTGWGRPFFDVLKGNETKEIRFEFEIYGPITDATWIRLQFYNPHSAEEYDFERWFKKVRLTYKHLEELGAVQKPFKAASESQAESELEVLDIKIDPIRQGKNVVHAKVKNNSEEDQVSRIQIFTRSPGVSGWGTSFLDVIKAGETRWIRHGCKISGPITEGTYIRLDFHNPGPLANVNVEKRQYGDGTDWFKRVRYNSNDLEHYQVDESQIKEASKDETDAVIRILRQIQDYIKNKEYESAWSLFTQDFKEAEFMYRYRAFERFKQKMERPVRYSLSGLELLALEPKSVTRQNDVFVLSAAMKDKLWTVDFVQAGGQYKLDSIGGVISNDWQERLLPLLQQRTTKHFDIYYFKDSTAEKEIELIVKEKEKGFEQICRFLGKDSDQRIRMIFFEDGETKRNATAHQGAGWAFGNTIVEIYNEEQKLDPYHETVHILMGPYGNPPALFNEGFATYMSERLGAKALKSLSGGQSSIYERVRELKSKGEWIELEELITYTDIGPGWSRPPISYPEAASFVKFLIDKYGKDKFLQAYKRLKNSGDETVQQRNKKKLEQIYNKPLRKLEDEWEKTFSLSHINGLEKS